MIIEPAHIPTAHIARLVYLICHAVSTALQVRGITDRRLYRGAATPLALWAGLTRGNTLALLRIVLDLIGESDRRRGCNTPQGHLRFRAARLCIESATGCVSIIPAGPVQGIAPLKLL